MQNTNILFIVDISWLDFLSLQLKYFMSLVWQHGLEFLLGYFLILFSFKQEMLHEVSLEHQLKRFGCSSDNLESIGIESISIMEDDSSLDPLWSGDNVWSTPAHCFQFLIFRNSQR